MIKDFFNIIDKHYLYRNFKEKLAILNKSEEFVNFIEEYVDFYNSDIQQNQKMLSLFAKTKIDIDKKSPDGKSFSLYKNIIFDDSIIDIDVSYESKLSIYSHKSIIKNLLKFSIVFSNKNKNSNDFTLEIEVSNTQDNESNNHHFSFKSMDCPSFELKSLPYKKSYHMLVQEDLSQPERLINQIMIQSVQVIGSSPKNGLFSGGYVHLENNLHHQSNEQYPEISCFDRSQISKLLLTGGMDKTTIELLKLTHDFGNSLDNYVRDDKDTIFNLFERNKSLLKTNNSSNTNKLK